MTPAEAMSEIERMPFALRLALSNSFRAFLRNISNEPAVKDLLASAQSREVALQLLQKILSLSKLRVDFRYLHRFDIPLATYLWILSRTHPNFANTGAEVGIYVPRTWWTEQVARYILEEFFSKSDTPKNLLVSRHGVLSDVNTTNVAASTSRFTAEPLPGFVPTEQVKWTTKSTGEGSTVRHSDLGENGLPSFDTAQAKPKEPAENQ